MATMSLKDRLGIPHKPKANDGLAGNPSKVRAQHGVPTKIAADPSKDQEALARKIGTPVKRGSV